MYIDQNEILRVRVEADEFYDDEPGPPKASEGVQVMKEPRRAPYNITVRLTVFSITYLISRSVFIVLNRGTGLGTNPMVESCSRRSNGRRIESITLEQKSSRKMRSRLLYLQHFSHLNTTISRRVHATKLQVSDNNSKNKSFILPPYERFIFS